jgi:hypothetical protein
MMDTVHKISPYGHGITSAWEYCDNPSRDEPKNPYDKGTQQFESWVDGFGQGCDDYYALNEIL